MRRSVRILLLLPLWALTLAAAPIWRVTGTPEPLPIVRITPGAPARLVLEGAATAPVRSILSVRAQEPLQLEWQVSGTELRLTLLDGESPKPGLLTILVETTRGEEEVQVPVVPEDRPLVRFRFKPENSATPTSVTVAGAFNGWNAASTPLRRKEDGSFEAKVPLPPGRHAYKFVVDGNWIADPANPQKEQGDYGNSLLDVASSRPSDFDFSQLSRGMLEGSLQGGATALVQADDALDPTSIAVLLNNRPLQTTHWKLEEDQKTLRFNLPDSDWKPDSFITLFARSKGGGTGSAVLPLHRPDDPRSPRDEVIYFAMTDRFHDGDPSLNRPAEDPRVHPLANYHGGDFAGIRKKIEEGYFERLGVTTLWISPVNENIQEVEQESVPPNGHYTSYHGYWPVSLTETNRQFGSIEDLRALVRTAHERGIAVLLDFVANHMHEQHPSIRAHPEWSVPRTTPDGRPNLRLYDEFPLTTWFDDFLPTLDYENQPALVELMVDNAVWWLRETGADGFRHDAVKHVPGIFWTTLTRRLNEEFHTKEGRFIYQLGETISNHETVRSYLGPDLLTGQFDFPIYFTLEAAIAKKSAPLSDIARAALRSRDLYPPASIMSPLLGNHDVIRFLAWADGDIPADKPQKEVGFRQPPSVDHPDSYQKLLLAFATLAALPGPPTLYYGDEIGMTGAHDPDNRRPMRWSWNEQESSIFNIVSNLNKIRGQSKALRRGRLEVLHADSELLVLARIAPTETALAVLSRKPTGTYRIPLPTHWKTPSLQPLFKEGSMDLKVDSGTLTIRPSAYSFSLHELKW